MRVALDFAGGSKGKKVVLALNVLLMLGLLAYSLIFFAINRIWNPFDGLLSHSDMLQRMPWRLAAGRICGISSAIYLLGHILMLNYGINKGRYLSIRTALLYLAVQITGMFLCTLPFALLDRAWLWDYLFPLRGLATSLLLLFALYFIAGLWRKRREAKGSF